MEMQKLAMKIIIDHKAHHYRVATTIWNFNLLIKFNDEEIFDINRAPKKIRKNHVEFSSKQFSAERQDRKKNEEKRERENVG